MQHSVTKHGIQQEVTKGALGKLDNYDCFFQAHDKECAMSTGCSAASQLVQSSRFNVCKPMLRARSTYSMLKGNSGHLSAVM